MYDKFADKLREIRRERGLSIAQLSQMLDVERTSVMEWECGDALPDADEFAKLIDVLGVSADTLMEQIDSPEPSHEPTVSDQIDALVDDLTNQISARFGANIDADSIASAVEDAVSDALEETESALHEDEGDDDPGEEDRKSVV